MNQNTLQQTAKALLDAIEGGRLRGRRTMNSGTVLARLDLYQTGRLRVQDMTFLLERLAIPRRGGPGIGYDPRAIRRARSRLQEIVWEIGKSELLAENLRKHRARQC